MELEVTRGGRGALAPGPSLARRGSCSRAGGIFEGDRLRPRPSPQIATCARRGRGEECDQTYRRLAFGSSDRRMRRAVRSRRASRSRHVDLGAARGHRRSYVSGSMRSVGRRATRVLEAPSSTPGRSRARRPARAAAGATRGRRSRASGRPTGASAAQTPKRRGPPRRRTAEETRR